MKGFSLLLLGLLSAGSAFPQTSSEAAPPGVTISKPSWRKDVYVPALLEDPMQANQEHADQEKLQKAVQRANVIRSRQGQTQLPPPPKNIYSTAIPDGPSVNFIYEAKVKNTGEKTIQAIHWEYVVFDPTTEVELGRRRFMANMKLRPGKEMTLTGFAATPPVRIIRAEKSEKQSEPKYLERVLIIRIEYSDGSFWQRPLQ